MQAEIDIEPLREELKKLSRKQARALAVNAGLAPATVEKFRLGHIKEPRFGKLKVLAEAIAAANAAPSRKAR